MSRPNLLSLFDDFHRQSKDIAAIQRRGYRRESWTYADLAKIALRLAHDLKQNGVRTGDRVVIWGPNCAEWIAAFWGCLLRGAVVVPIDDGATPDFAARVARETSTKVVIASRGKPILAAAIPALNLEDLPDRSREAYITVTVRDPHAMPPHICQSLADEPITRNHVAQILFTSGTTAEPRGVVLTHGNFLANLEPLERGIVPYRKYERWLHPLRFVTLVPISHVFGQFMALFVPPLLGAAVVFEPSPNASEVIRTVKRERATALITVPHMLDLLRNGILRDLAALGEVEWFERTFAAANGRKFLRRAWMFRRVRRRFGWKFWAFISGGAALSAETEEFFKRLGYAVVQGYGMTETASLISLNHPFRAAQGSIGKVLPGREFRLGEDGEILVRGENVARGYWQKGTLQDSGATEENGGWLGTGDLGELDAQGNLRFRGRKKSVIVTPAGLNVYPEDLETALRKQLAVRDAVVIPLDRNGNAEPFAALLLRDGDEAAARLAIEGANNSLAEYQRIRRWIIWPEPDFPRTPTGKPKLAAIAAVATKLSGAPQNDEPAAVAATSRGGRLSSESTDGVSNIVASLARHDGSQDLERDLNLSSLDRVELMSALEQRYQTELNETAFANAKTVGDVQRLLHDPATRRTEYSFPRWAQREAVRWMRLAVYYGLVWPSTQILAHPKIVGRDHLKDLRGPLLVICNHVTRRADIGLVLAALPPRFRNRLATAIGGETLHSMWRPPREWFFAKRWAYQLGYWLIIALFNVFPLPRFSGFRESFRYAGESVDRGYSVLVFPEGEITKNETGEMQPFHSGMGLLAENLRIPIVPIRMDGVWQMKREGRRLARRGEITMRIGPPVTFALATPPDEIAQTLESVVRNL
ncbi:MAG: AMP-dependent synthetase and ligase [Candidatus Acidoferrum typicum]|nr:AMP-dependent synthetase and ligase [Candidatus Acidoferrum typicum]